MAREQMREYDVIVSLLATRLPEAWCAAYDAHTPHATNVLAFTDNGFEYLFDFSSELQKKGVLGPMSAEDRLVAVHGRSRPPQAHRHDPLMRGHPLGPVERLGPAAEPTDRGHFIAHSIGGRYDVNLFPQQRALNRGWSAAGKRFRAMESYCHTHPSTYCFSRPVYDGLSAHPARVEFGVLKHDRILWVEQFDNAADPETITRIEAAFREVL